VTAPPRSPAGSRRPARAALAGLALALGLAVTSMGQAQDESGLRRLAERLVGVWGAPGEMRVDLHVAGLPADMVAVLPLPETFDLVGSLARYERDELVALQVVLDGPARPGEAFAALRAAFEAEDWAIIADNEPAEVGFVPTIQTVFARACAPEGRDGPRPVAYLNATPGAPGTTDVRIDLTPDAWEGACIPHPPHREDRARYAPLPTLGAPPDSEVTGSLVSLEVENATAHAVLRGAVPIAEIVAHYEAQLEALGWSPVPGAVTDDFGTRSPWSLVTGAGRLWVGLLSVDRPTRTGPAMLSFAVVAEPGP
jgi:hypothetical protein